MKRYATLFSDGSMNVHVDVKGKSALTLAFEEATEANNFERQAEEMAQVVELEIDHTTFRIVDRTI
jgi:hypothetical protein